MDGNSDGPIRAALDKVPHHASLLGVTVSVALALVFLGLGLLLFLYVKRRPSKKKKMKRMMRGGGAGHGRDGVGPPLSLRRPTAVRNPASNSHYLKKSPSPTGCKSPPGADRLSPSGGSSPAGSEGTTKKNSPKGSPVEEKGNNGAQEDNINAMNNNKKKLDVISYENEKNPTSDAAVEQNSKSNDSAERLGKLYFKLRHKQDNGALIVTIVKCTDLSQTDGGQNSDPYVKLQLLPDKHHKAKTRVLRNTLNPVYDEDFTFYGITQEHLKDLTLHFVVLSFDRYSRDDIIGEVVTPLAQVDLQDSVTLSRPINPRSMKGRGELLLSLCHQPAATRLTVVVLKARNLPKMDITGLSDPYVKIYLLYNGQRVSKKKTHVKKRTVNPVFNESFVFDLPQGAQDLSNVSLECLLLDWDRVTKNEVIGRLELGGSRAVGSAKHHWEEVVNSPRRQIAEWHKLREAHK